MVTATHPEAFSFAAHPEANFWQQVSLFGGGEDERACVSSSRTFNQDVYLKSDTSDLLCMPSVSRRLSTNRTPRLGFLRDAGCCYIIPFSLPGFFVVLYKQGESIYSLMGNFLLLSLPFIVF